MVAWYYAGLDEKVGSQPEDTGATGYRVRGNNSQIIRDVGAASIVLLKNTNNALPLSAPQIVAIFGSHAGSAMVSPFAPPFAAFILEKQSDSRLFWNLVSVTAGWSKLPILCGWRRRRVLRTSYLARWQRCPFTHLLGLAATRFDRAGESG